MRQGKVKKPICDEEALVRHRTDDDRENHDNRGFHRISFAMGIRGLRIPIKHCLSNQFVYNVLEELAIIKKDGLKNRRKSIEWKKQGG
jgi:hypothetical protein